MLPFARRTLARQPPPPALYASSYTPERGAAICRRLAAGESLRAICRDDPAMPTEKTVWNWARAHPAFRLMKAHALETGRARARAAQEARDAAKRAWPAAKDRRGWRRGRDGYSVRVADEVCVGLMMGLSLEDVCRLPGAPSVGTVYNWLRAHPEFVDEYRRAKAMGQAELIDTCCEHLVQPERERDHEPLLRRTVRAAEKRAARLALDGYAPAVTSPELRVQMADPGGTVRTLYHVRREG
jgi:hypothetical protein